jgi:hypothetical protein
VLTRLKTGAAESDQTFITGFVAGFIAGVFQHRNLAAKSLAA